MLPYFVESTFLSPYPPQISEAIDVFSLNDEEMEKTLSGLFIICILVFDNLIIKQTQEPLLIK